MEGYAMASEEPLGTPAYIPFKTFTNTLDALAEHMPNRIDGSAFPGQSGTMKSQLLLTFRFFGLIGEDGKPTQTLLAIAVADEAARKAALRKLIEQKYAPLFALGLMKTTPAEFAETMTEAYKISGDTRLKATRFFLNALAYLGIVDVSPLLLRDKTKPVGNGAMGRRRRAAPRERINTAEEEAEAAREAGVPMMAESRTVELRSGGKLTLSATTKFMSLSSADRKFVFDLIDKLEEYEASQQ
jgi:hypothetical protein